MCIQPIKVYSRSKRITDGELVLHEVPCGCCAECSLSKIDNYYVRCHEELEQVKRNGGFVYFDTLTYSDENLPVHYGISHFNSKHIVDYIRNLRKTLKKKYGLESKRDFADWKYFITCEYGTDESKTHRPHYHCLFFVYKHVITPDSFHKLISEKWRYGITDQKNMKDYTNGIVFTSSSIPNFTPKFPPRFAINYVCKYVNKDTEFYQKLKGLSEEQIYLLNQLKVEEEFDYRPFLKISINFGASLIDQNNPYNAIRQLIELGSVTLKDESYRKEPRTIPIPAYYYRKLLFNYHKVYNYETGEKKVKWEKNDNYILFKLYNDDRLLHEQAARYERLFNPTLVGHSFCDGQGSIYDHVKQLLDGRSWLDFATYVRFYRNRLNREDRDLDPLRVFSYRDALLDIEDFEKNKIDLYNYFNDANFGEGGVRAYLRNRMITQDSCFAFRHFDELYSVVVTVKHFFGVQKQIKYDQKQENLRKLKKIFPKGSSDNYKLLNSKLWLDENSHLSMRQSRLVSLSM